MNKRTYEKLLELGGRADLSAHTQWLEYLKNSQDQEGERWKLHLEHGIARRGPLDLSHAKLTGLSLAGFDFSGAYFDFTDFNGADLRDAKFAGASVFRSSFVGATLTGTDFSGASVSRCDFRSANDLDDSKWKSGGGNKF